MNQKPDGKWHLPTTSQNISIANPEDREELALSMGGGFGQRAYGRHLVEAAVLSPYDNARNTGQLMRVIKKHERENSVPAPEEWWKPAPTYNNETDVRHRENGEDYSFITYVGHAQLGIIGMNASVDLSKDRLDFLIPMYLIQGQEDLLTPTEINEAFFDKINAPEKEYVIVPEAAHGINEAVVDMHFSILNPEYCLWFSHKRLEETWGRTR